MLIRRHIFLLLLTLLIALTLAPACSAAIDLPVVVPGDYVVGPGITFTLQAGSTLPEGSTLTVQPGATVNIQADGIGTSIGGAGSVVFSGNDSIKYSGTLSGPLNVKVDMGSGSVALANQPQYKGSTQVNSGTLWLEQPNSTLPNLSGSGTVDFSTSSTYTLNLHNSTDTTFSGEFHKLSGLYFYLRKQGPGTLTLTAPQPDLTHPTIEEGTLALRGNASFPSTARLDLCDDGVLDISGVNSLSLCSIRGNGTVNLGGKTLNFTSQQFPDTLGNATCPGNFTLKGPGTVCKYEKTTHVLFSDAITNSAHIIACEGLIEFTTPPQNDGFIQATEQGAISHLTTLSIQPDGGKWDSAYGALKAGALTFYEPKGDMDLGKYSALFSRPGYRLTGWADGQGHTYGPKAKFAKTDADQQLTAQWSYIPTNPTPTLEGKNELTAVPKQAGNQVIAATLSGASFGGPLTVNCHIGDVVKTVTATANGPLQFTFTPADLAPLAGGTYTIKAQSLGNGNNEASALTDIGTLALTYRPVLTGDNDLRVLPGHMGGVGLAAILSGADPNSPVQLTVTVGGKTVTTQLQGDGMVQFVAALPEGATGELAIAASAPATATSAAIPQTPLGTVTVVDLRAHLTGDLAAKLGADWMMVPVTDGIFLGAQGGLTVDDQARITVGLGDAFAFATNWDKGAVDATLSRVRVGVFGKSAQPVPDKLALRVKGARGKGAAIFRFTAQDMGRLSPGLYLLGIESPRLGAVNLVTLRVRAAAPQPATWTVPKALKVSAGQQYQLVKPLTVGGALPPLTAASNKGKVATVTNEGVIAAHKPGTALITVTDGSGASLKCKLQVVGNAFSRKKPLIVKGKPGLYTSTKRLYYSQGNMIAHVFLANRTGAPAPLEGNFLFQLYDGEGLVYQQPIDPATLPGPLKKGKTFVYQLALTNDMLPGVSAKTFDLGSGRFQAVIRGGACVPMAPAP